MGLASKPTQTQTGPLRRFIPVTTAGNRRGTRADDGAEDVHLCDRDDHMRDELVCKEHVKSHEAKVET